MASRELISHDIVALRIYDQIGQYFIPKEKIVFGPDGTAIDVTYDTPFPVLGTFAPQEFADFGQGTPTTVPVTDSSTILLSPNTDRKWALIVNNSSQRIFLQYGSGSAVFKQGIPLSPNSMWEINTENLFIGQLSAITDSGSVNIDVIEGV